MLNIFAHAEHFHAADAAFLAGVLITGMIIVRVLWAAFGPKGEK